MAAELPLPPSASESNLIELWEQLDAARMRLGRLAPPATTRFEQRALRAAYARVLEALDAYHSAVEDCLVERGVDPGDERFVP